MAVVEAELSDLPGAEIVLPGLEDLRAGRETIDSAAVLVAADRLRRVGLDVPAAATADEHASHRLYDLIGESGVTDAHSRHHAMQRRVVSFARALEGARSR